MRRPSSSLLVLVALLALPAAAQATATPIFVSPGSASHETDPAVAVGTDGTAFIVYETASHVGYCRLPAGAGACATQLTFTDPGPSADHTVDDLNVFARAGKVYVYGKTADCTPAGTLDDIVEYVSANNGVTFGGPICRNSHTTYTQTGGGFLDGLGQFVTGGGPASDEGQFVTTLSADTVDDAFDPATVFSPGPYPGLVVSGDTSGHLVAAGVTQTGGHIRYAVYGGHAPVAPAAQNTGSNWVKDLSLAGDPSPEQGPLLIGGSDGTWMAYLTDDGSATRGVEMLNLEGFTGTSRFESPVAPTIGVGEAPLDLAATEANNGDELVTYIDTNDNLRYASRTTAHALQTLGTIANIPGSYVHQQVAANANEQGVDVWDDGDRVFAVALTPTPDPPLSIVTPPGTGTPIPTPIPISAPAPTSPGSLPNAPTHSKTVKNSDGSSFGLSTPKACVAPGHTFTVTLGFKKSTKKHHGHGVVYVKVSKVDFSVGASKVKTDKKAPFRQTLTVTASTKKGSTVTVKARATLKIHHGKPRAKSITTTVKVCA